MIKRIKSPNHSFKTKKERPESTNGTKTKHEKTPAPVFKRKLNMPLQLNT